MPKKLTRTDGLEFYTLDLMIPGLPRMGNASGRSRGFWAIDKERKRVLAQVAALVGAQRPAKPLETATLVCTRASSVQPDADGLVAGFKWVIDGLVKCGVLANDKWKNIAMPEYRWERVKPGSGYLRVLVTETVTPKEMKK